MNWYKKNVCKPVFEEIKYQYVDKLDKTRVCLYCKHHDPFLWVILPEVYDMKKDLIAVSYFGSQWAGSFFFPVTSMVGCDGFGHTAPSSSLNHLYSPKSRREAYEVSDQNFAFHFQFVGLLPHQVPRHPVDG